MTAVEQGSRPITGLRGRHEKHGQANENLASRFTNGRPRRRRDERHRGFCTGPPAGSSSSPGVAPGAATERKSRLSAAEFRFGQIVSSGPASRRTDASSRVPSRRAARRSPRRYSMRPPASVRVLLADSLEGRPGAAARRGGRESNCCQALERAEIRKLDVKPPDVMVMGDRARRRQSAFSEKAVPLGRRGRRLVCG